MDGKLLFFIFINFTIKHSRAVTSLLLFRVKLQALSSHNVLNAWISPLFTTQWTSVINRKFLIIFFLRLSLLFFWQLIQLCIFLFVPYLCWFLDGRWLDFFYEIHSKLRVWSWNFSYVTSSKSEKLIKNLKLPPHV